MHAVIHTIRIPLGFLKILIMKLDLLHRRFIKAVIEVDTNLIMFHEQAQALAAQLLAYH